MNNKMTLLERAPTMGHLTNETCSELTVPLQTGREREREEKEEVSIDRIECTVGRVSKKKKLKSDTVRWTLATQNFRGLTSEEAREEVALQMEKASIDIVCGQETWMADCKAGRWDTGEVYTNYGKDFEGKASGRSEGVCFILNERMAAAFEKGGKRTKKYCPRLATMRMPISRQEQLHIINAHAPDSGQSKARRMGFQRRLDAALEDCKEGEIPNADFLGTIFDQIVFQLDLRVLGYAGHVERMGNERLPKNTSRFTPRTTTTKGTASPIYGGPDARWA
jgi:hypothetical protein